MVNQAARLSVEVSVCRYCKQPCSRCALFGSVSRIYGGLLESLDVPWVGNDKLGVGYAVKEIA